MSTKLWEENEKASVATTRRTLRLTSLSLRNFKGIKQFNLDLDGASASVFGENALGKTTLADAWFWLLFGKDTQGRVDFEIKTLSAEGEPLHGLTHEVEATIEIDGVSRQFQKSYEEKWTKKRGAATQEFTGHTTKHFIDGVPVKQSEFTAAVSELADELTFRLLTDPGYFSDGLHWQDRRRILLEVCGDVSDVEVIASDDRLKDLPNILGKRSMEDHRKVIASKRVEINRELDRIPVRIDEVSRSLPKDEDAVKLTEELERLRLQKEEAEQERARINAGGELAEKQKRLSEISARMLTLETEARRTASDRYHTAVSDTRNRLGMVRQDIRDKEEELSSNQSRIESCQSQISALEARMERMRDEWTEIDAETLQYAGEATCAACGQDLPSDRVEEARQKAEEEFNLRKSRRLTEIDDGGKRMKGEVEDFKVTVQRTQNENDVLAKQLENLREQFVKLQAQVDAIPAAEEPKFPEEHATLAVERGTVEREIVKLRETTEPALEAASEKIRVLNEVISGVEARLQDAETYAKGEARIDALKDDEKRLAKEFERLEQELFLCEEFVRAKVSMLEERINSRFRLARFKLFKTLVNGGLDEICETSFEGVPWGSLNHGSKANVGLDIISTLQRHYGFSPCIWIDQAESFLRLPAMECQVIRLVVSEGDKKLRLETQP